MEPYGNQVPREGVMDRNREQVRLELAQLVMLDFRSAADARLNAVRSHQRTNHLGRDDAESCAPLELAQIQARLFP